MERNKRSARFNEKVCQVFSYCQTNYDDSCPGLITQDQFLPGDYRIHLNTSEYFKNTGIKGFYPYVDVVFTIENPNQHYHFPLLLSPYEYPTYKGS